MVEVARLLLEIDSTGAQKGAKDAASALDQTATAAAKATTAVTKVAGASTAAGAEIARAAQSAQTAEREITRATGSLDRYGTSTNRARELSSNLAASVLGVQGPLVSLATRLTNVTQLFSDLGAVAASPLGAIGLLGAGLLGTKSILDELNPTFDVAIDKLDRLSRAYKAASGALSPAGFAPQEDPFANTGISKKSLEQYERILADLKTSEAAKLAREGVPESGFFARVRGIFGGDSATGSGGTARVEAIRAITDARSEALETIRQLKNEPLDAQIAVEKQLTNLFGSGSEADSIYGSPQLAAALADQIAKTQELAKATEEARSASEKLHDEQKRQIDDTLKLKEAQDKVAESARARFDATVSQLKREAEFGGQGPGAVERANVLAAAQDLALKATGGNADQAAGLVAQLAAAYDAAQVSSQAFAAQEKANADALRETARATAEATAAEQRRIERQEAARASAQAEISALSRRGTGLGAIPDTLGGFESARREQDIQSKLAAYRAKIADLPFDEQESAAARYEATLRDVVERETAWTDQEKLLKDELEQSKKAIEEHQKRVEDLAHAYADPLGKGLDDLFGKLQDGELSWKSFAATALNAMKEISAGVFHELVTRPITESIVNTLTGRSGNVSGGGGFYGGSGGGGFGAGDSFGGGGAENVGTGRSASIFSSALGGGLSAGLGKILPGLFGRRSEEPPIPLDAMLAYARAQSGTPSFDAADRLYFGGGGRLPWDDSSATAQPTSGIVDPQSTPGGTGGFSFDFFNLLGLGTQSWLQNPGSFFLGGGGGFGFGFARGAAFSRGRVIPFYRGDVFDNPTTFPMAGGDTGMLGERGPEAILPLARGSDGRLGVRASGARGGSGDERDRSGGGTTVINNWRITTPNADSFRKSRRHMDQDATRRASRG